MLSSRSRGQARAERACVSLCLQPEEKNTFDGIFESLSPVGGLLSGDKVKPVLINSKLPLDVLGKVPGCLLRSFLLVPSSCNRCAVVPVAQVWDLSDIDKDGHLDKDEFAVVSLASVTWSGGGRRRRGLAEQLMLCALRPCTWCTGPWRRRRCLHCCQLHWCLCPRGRRAWAPWARRLLDCLRAPRRPRTLCAQPLPTAA